MLNSKKNNSALEHGIHIANESQLDPLFESTQRILKDSDLLSQIAKNKANCIHAQGWQFEQIETLKFNMNAASQGRFDLFAATTDGLGRPHDAADILIQDTQGNVLREAQLKSYDSAAGSAFSLADRKYEGMQRVAPADQHEKVQSLYQERIAKGSLKADDYQDAKENLSKGIAHDGVTSGGTSRQEALDAANPAHAEKIAQEFRQKAMVNEMHQTGHQAGIVGAAVGGGITVVGEVYTAFKDGEVELSEVLFNISKNTAQSYVTSYATGAAGRGIAHLAEKNLSAGAAATLVKSNAHIAIATGAVKAGKSMYRYLTDESMTTEELLSDISHIAMTGAGAFYYGAIGQALIPIPVVGALVGSTVGYFIGNLIHQSGLLSLGESTNVKISRERREQIEKSCLEIIPKMRESRHQMEKILDEYKIARQSSISEIFNNIESSMVAADANQYIQSLTQLNGMFGNKNLAFSNMDEFNDLMEDDDFVFKL